MADTTDVKYALIYCERRGMNGCIMGVRVLEAWYRSR